MTRVDIRYGDDVFLMAPIPDGVGPDDASKITKRRSESVEQILAKNDIETKGLLRSVGESKSSDDNITVVVRRHVVTLPACPDWTGSAADNATNQPASNWSCATATNLGMMVADPGDLARGQQPGYADGELVAGSIERYRKGETAPLMDDVNTQETFESGGGFRAELTFRIWSAVNIMLTKVLPKKSAGNQSSAFAAFVSDDDSCAAVIEAANDLGLTDPPVTKGVIKDAIQHLAKASTPELLVVDLSGSADPLAEITSLAEVCDEGTRVVTVGDLNDINLYRDLVAIGVNDYLLKPISAAGLGAAFTRVEEAPETEAKPAEQGRLITVIGARGGVGATSVAVNCAWSIAHELKKRVALIDLDIFFGNCGLALDLESGRGFREALENPSRIDGLFIERAMVRESDNLFVLSAEETLEQALQFNSSAVELLLDHLRRDFQYVIVDLPRFGARTQSSILVPPASVLVVSDPSLPGMRDTMRLAKLFKKTAATNRHLRDAQSDVER